MNCSAIHYVGIYVRTVNSPVSEMQQINIESEILKVFYDVLKRNEISKTSRNYKDDT